MIISNYLKMNYTELEDEISKQKKKIDSAKETIRLLRKLQIAVEAEAEKKKPQNSEVTQTQAGKPNNQNIQNPQSTSTQKPELERKSFNGSFR